MKTTLDTVQTIIIRSNGYACGGNWVQLLYTVYKDLVGTEKAEKAWDLQEAAEYVSIEEFEFWATLISLICREILETIG